MFVCPDCGHSQASAGPCPNDQTELKPRGDDPLIGQMVHGYRIAKLLGVGGMGRVYKGVHPSIGSRVAVKVLSRECADRPDLVERFFSEARAVNLIRHESIVNVLDLNQLPDGRPYIIMEYLDGAPLADLVEKMGPMPLGSLARLVAECLDALAAAHAKSIVHRDLKPDNIFITPAGHPKVLDFGIAKLRPEMGGSATQTGSLLGTPHYMSPEQAMGKPVDLRTDIYAIGVILFECATGRRPFLAESLFDLLRKHVDEAPPPPRSLRPDMPPALEQVIMFALAKDPARRYQTCPELANALMQATAGMPPEAWAPISPGSAARLTAQHGPASGAGWGPGSWPGSQAPTPPPYGHQGGFPPGTGPMMAPPPSSVAQAAGQMIPPHGQPPPRTSSKGLFIGLAALAVVGGGIAVAVAVGGGGSSSSGSNGSGGSGSASGSEAASGSGSASGSEAENGSGSGSGSGSVAVNDGSGSGSSGDSSTSGGAADALHKKLANFKSGIPQCDEFVRAYAAMIDCPALASSRAQLISGVEQMMDGYGAYASMDASMMKQVAAQAGPACQQGLDAMKQSLSQMGCDKGGGGGGGGGGGSDQVEDDTTDDTSGGGGDADIIPGKVYNLKIAGFKATGWDFMAWYPTAMAEAKKHFPDAQLTRIDAKGVSPDGLVHFDLSDDFDVLYRFVSPSAAKQPADHPKGLKWEPLCMVQIIVEADDTTVIPMKGFGCETPIPQPKCNAKQVWGKAQKRGAPASNAYAELWYGVGEKGQWNFEIEDTMDEEFPDGC